MTTVILWLIALGAIAWLSMQVVFLREDVADLRRERKADEASLAELRRQVRRLRLRQVPAINRVPVSWLDELDHHIRRAS